MKNDRITARIADAITEKNVFHIIKRFSNKFSNRFSNMLSKQELKTGSQKMFSKKDLK